MFEKLKKLLGLAEKIAVEDLPKVEAFVGVAVKLETVYAPALESTLPGLISAIVSENPVAFIASAEALAAAIKAAKPA